MVYNCIRDPTLLRVVTSLHDTLASYTLRSAIMGILAFTMVSHEWLEAAQNFSYPYNIIE